jgi:hypothetical protein
VEDKLSTFFIARYIAIQANEMLKCTKIRLSREDTGPSSDNEDEMLLELYGVLRAK